MDIKKYIYEDGKNNEKKPEPKDGEISKKNESETERAIRIILGIEETMQAGIVMKASNESSIIERAREFRLEFEKMKKK